MKKSLIIYTFFALLFGTIGFYLGILSDASIKIESDPHISIYKTTCEIWVDHTKENEVVTVVWRGVPFELESGLRTL